MHPLVICIAQLRQNPQTVQGVVEVVHWKVKLREERIGWLPVMVVRLVNTVHEEKLCPAFDGVFHLSGPLSTRNL